MRRDAIAIALYVYLAVVLTPQTLRLVPLTGALQTQPAFLATVTSGSVWIGCAICALSTLWRDELDGRAVEMFGIAIACTGWMLYIYAFATFLPRSYLGLSLVGGFLLAFSVQWWILRRWRKQLKALAGSRAE